MSLLLTRKMDCCCTPVKGIVFECFPTMCPDGWRKLFGYSAGQRRNQLRFFVRCFESDIENMIQAGFPNKPFHWWDHAFISAQRGGGGQVWRIDKDASAANNLSKHKDFLFGSSNGQFPQDPRAFINNKFPVGLRPPPNAYIFLDDDGNPLPDELQDDGDFLEVAMFSGLDQTRSDITTNAFSDKPGRLTNSEFDNFGVNTLPDELDPEFTFIESSFAPTDFPAFFNLKVQRASHLFHYNWNLCFRNYDAFGQPDENNLPAYAEPGTGGGVQSPDTPLNIYFWQRWIAHAEPSGSGMYGLQFAVEGDYWDRSRGYVHNTRTFPNMPACGTSFQDAQDAFEDGTANCDLNVTYETPKTLPSETTSQIYALNPTGAAFQLSAPGGLYQWPRGSGTPTFPDNLRNRSGDGTDGCTGNEGGNACNSFWGGPTQSISGLINFEYKTEEVMVVDILTNASTGAFTSTNDPFNILLYSGSPYAGSVDNYTSESGDNTKTSPRVFAWPTTFTMSMNVTGNYQSGASIDCPVDSQFNGFIVDPGILEETKSVKFPICDLLEERLSVDCYSDRGPDKGPVVTMDCNPNNVGGGDRTITQYLHPGINYGSLYSTCSGAGLVPPLTGSGLTNTSAATHGIFKLSATSGHISVYGGTQCNNTGSLNGCNTDVDGACLADMDCGEDVGFFMNRIFGDTTEPGRLFYSQKGIYTLGLEPSSSFGTVPN